MWRVWGSQSLQPQANVQFLTRLVTRIMNSSQLSHLQQPTTNLQVVAPPPLLRLPVGPPTSPISHYDKHLQNNLNQTSHTELNSAINKMSAAPQPIPLAQPKPKPMNDPKSPLHSILKKPNTTQPEHHKTTLFLLEKPDGTSVLRSPGTPPTPHPDDAAAKKGTGYRQKTTPKKPYFSLLKGVRNAYRRPVLPRRKTTQTTIPRATSPPPPRRNQSQPVLPLPLITLNEGALTQQLNQEMEIESGDEDVTDSCAGSSPFDTPAPLSRQSTGSTTPPQTSSFIDALRESRRPFIHPAVNVPTDNQILAVPRKTKIATAVPQLFKNDDGRLEIEHYRSQSIHKTYYITQPEGTAVPGFTNAKRIPMPKIMLDDLVSIITNPDPVQGKTTIPSRPWIWSEGVWHKPDGEQPLHDWMIRDEDLAQGPQPSLKPLVAKDFRKKFAETGPPPPVYRPKKKKHARKKKQGLEKPSSSAPVQDSLCKKVET